MNIPEVRLGFPYNDFLNGIWREVGDPEAVPLAYAEALRSELQPMTEIAEVRTHGRTPLEAGGPGVEFDLVEVAFRVAEAYVVLKEVVRDLRRILEWMAAHGDGRVFIDQAAAAILAADAVSPDDTHINDIEVLSTDTLLGARVDMEAERGYVVKLRVNGDPVTVVVTTGGSVLGATGEGVRPGLPRPDAFDRLPDEPRAWQRPEGASPDGTWVEGPDGTWEWDDGPFEYVEPSEEERQAAKRRMAEWEEKAKTDPRYRTLWHPDSPVRPPWETRGNDSEDAK